MTNSVQSQDRGANPLKQLPAAAPDLHRFVSKCCERISSHEALDSE
mgnify:CR=1 FL=1